MQITPGHSLIKINPKFEKKLGILYHFALQFYQVLTFHFQEWLFKRPYTAKSLIMLWGLNILILLGSLPNFKRYYSFSLNYWYNGYNSSIAPSASVSFFAWHLCWRGCNIKVPVLYIQNLLLALFFNFYCTIGYTLVQKYHKSHT